MLLGQVGWTLGSVWAFTNTIQSHAYTLTVLHGVITILIMWITCKRLHKYEKIAVVGCILAAVLIILDPNAKRVGETVNPLVSALAILVSLPATIKWYFITELKRMGQPTFNLVVTEILF